MKATTKFIQLNEDLKLESGKVLKQPVVAYQTYGVLNDKKNNVILVCHALSGDAHAAFECVETKNKMGWWDGAIGPDKAIDTDQFFIISMNCLGSCKGTTGPLSQNPETNKQYGLDFPVITIKDMVALQKKACDMLGINSLFCAIGPSMGGMQVLEWAINYPNFVDKIVCIATTSKLSPQALSFGAVGRHSIVNDPDWNKGCYSEHISLKGLAIARMIGHITYLSELSLKKKFGRKLQESDQYTYSFDTEFQIESYLKYQGEKFVKRFDANSYLYLSKAMSYFDLEKTYGSLQKALKNITAKALILSISSDWLYPTKQNKEIAQTMIKLNKEVSFCEIESDYGHDSFLVEVEKFANYIRPFLGGP